MERNAYKEDYESAGSGYYAHRNTHIVITAATYASLPSRGGASRAAPSARRSPVPKTKASPGGRVQTVRNPVTGRPIQVGGKVYNQLLREGKITGKEETAKRMTAQPTVPFSQLKVDEAHVARIKDLPLYQGVRTMQARGWGGIKPGTSERHALKTKCGDACFLRPVNNGYPVCPKLSATGGECQVACQGLAAAKTRARFLPPEYREKVIPGLQEHFGCSRK